MNGLKIGSVLIAKDPCVMDDDGKETLTIGNEYIVTQLASDRFTIIDDDNDPHDFLISELDYFFTN